MTKIDPVAIEPPTLPSPPVTPAADSEAAKPPRTTLTTYAKRINPEEFPDHPSASGRVPATLANVGHLLAACRIQVSYDVIGKRISITHADQELDEADLVSLANLNNLPANWMLDFVATLARRNPVNPVADWIRSKAWDGVDRLQAFYATVEVQDDFPTEMRDALLYRWMLSVTAAALVPFGFKARGVLVLQGEQGIGKTSWIARLAPPAKSAKWIKQDHHLDPHNKDSVFGAVTHWITEIGELDSSFRKDIARLKGFLTNDADKMRLPYARSPQTMERRTVFAGTVNEWNFLIDPTGNTRWWTIPATKLQFNHEIDMQQVYAQLATLLERGEQWHLTAAEEATLEGLNCLHQTMSVIAERLRSRIAGSDALHRYMTATQVLEEIGFRSPTNAQCKECGSELRAIYGLPKRINGIMKWKVALKPENVWEKHPDDDLPPEEIY